MTDDKGRFVNRQEAGKLLVGPLASKNLHNPLLLALPGGSVSVALPVGHALNADVVVAYSEPETETHAPTRGGAARERMRERRRGDVSVFDVDAVGARITSDRLHAEFDERVDHREHRERIPDVAGRDVVVVSDGIAPDRALQATVWAVLRRKPNRILIAAPVLAAGDADTLSSEVEDIVALELPTELGTVNDWYWDTAEPSESQVKEMLDRYSNLQSFRRAVLTSSVAEA